MHDSIREIITRCFPCRNIIFNIDNIYRPQWPTSRYSMSHSARTLIPKARQRLPQLQKTARQEDRLRCQVLQEHRTRLQDTQGGHRVKLHRQEVSLHLLGHHQRQDFEGNRHLHQDAAHCCGQKGLPALRPQVQQIRKTPQKHSGPRLTCLLSERRRYRAHRRMQAADENSALQRAEGDC